MSQYELRGATCLVTGGAGLIGSHIVEQLIDSGAAEVRVLDSLVRGRRDNLRGAEARGRVRFIQGDVRDWATVHEATAGCAYVFHEAAGRCNELPRERVEIRDAGSLHVFEAAVRANVRKVVYASSAGFSGTANSFNERLAHRFFDSHGLAGVGLRYGDVYGPRMGSTGDSPAVLIRWLDCIGQDQLPRINADESASMDLVYVEDAARASLLALRSERNDDVYPIASGTETTLAELWRTLQEVTCAYYLEPEFHPTRGASPCPRQRADTCLARRHLGFVARIGLTEGLARVVAWRMSLEEQDRPALVAGP